MLLRPRTSLVVVLLASFATSLQADEPSFLSKLNPFDNNDAPAKSSRASDDESGFHFPKLPTPKMPDWGSKPASRPSKPSAWTRMTTGTKSFFSKTADALNPFDDADDKPKSSTRSASRSTTRQKPKQESGGFFSWFGSKEPEEQPLDTVNDFLALPRPSY